MGCIKTKITQKSCPKNSDHVLIPGQLFYYVVFFIMLFFIMLFFIMLFLLYCFVKVWKLSLPRG